MPIRLTVTVIRNGSNWCGPRLPAVFSAQPTPAQQTEMRTPSGTAASTCSGSVTSQRTNVAPSSLRERLALLGVEVGDRHLRARLRQPARGGRAEARCAARHQGRGSLDSHGAGTYTL